MSLLQIIFDTNAKELRRLQRNVEKISELEPKVKKLTSQEITREAEKIRGEIRDGRSLDDALPWVFALVREAAVRTLGQRHFDVQMMGGIVLHEGRIAEMKTGEGKTLAATPALALNALTGEGAHVVTVNDYLARRDAAWMGPIYEMMGLSVGCLQHHLGPSERKVEYGKDITYGTNSEFGFDYLRDNMVIHKEDMVQRALVYAIVDEVDSILIDEARTPLIISGTANQDVSMYYRADEIVRRLSTKNITGEEKVKDPFALKKEEQPEPTWDYEYDEKAHSAALTAKGIAKVEMELGIENLFAFENTETAHYITQAMKSRALFKSDREYIVKDGQVIIVDEFTGRLMYGRRYSDGLHQAIEAKEGLKVASESQTLATITLQNYFRLYRKIAGMTGTAKTEEEEFRKIYGMDVVVIPTNRPMIRKDWDDQIYRTEKAKFRAIVDNIVECHEKGKPVLVGTISIEKSERLSEMLTRRGIRHTVLNAKHHEKEAEIIALAGQNGAVTIATNMAGRGTDIVLGDGVPDIGGLMVIGSERHEARRIDNQLRGRSGRQGDMGESRFYISIEDDLMRLYGMDRIEGLMSRMNYDEDIPLEHPWLSKTVEIAQKRVEGRNFEIRRTVLNYDDVMNKQREVVYRDRRNILKGTNMKEQIISFIETTIKNIIASKIVQTTSRLKEIDYEGIVMEAKMTFPLNSLAIEDIEGLSENEIEELISRRVHVSYEAREAELGEELMREVERVVALRMIDEDWIEQLNMLDHLREGIGLRGYAQQDPIVAYTNESFELFKDFQNRVQQEIVNRLFKVRVKVERTSAYNVTGQTTTGGSPAMPITRRAAKVGRNDPCPCGSGKKYKKCHGSGV